MKRTFSLIIALAFSGLVFSQSISPDVIASAGDFYSNGTISISWTLGEVATETIGNGTITLTQGFQQPSYVVVSAPLLKDNPFEIKMFPNPATDYIKITLKGNNNVDLLLDVYDAIGRKLIATKIVAGETEKSVDMSAYRPGVYFFKFAEASGKNQFTYQVAKIK